MIRCTAVGARISESKTTHIIIFIHKQYKNFIENIRKKVSISEYKKAGLPDWLMEDGGKMLKIRLQGTVNDIKWFQKIIKGLE